jgi:hypothetical protein
MVSQGVEAPGPELAVLAKPLIDLRQPVGAQSIDSALRVSAHLDQLGLAQHAEVARYRRLSQLRQGGNQFSSRAFTLGERIQQGPAAGLSDGLKHIHTDQYRIQRILSKIYITGLLGGVVGEQHTRTIVFMPAPSDAEHAVVAQWRAAGPVLAEVRRRELREMTDEQALAAVMALLDLLLHLPPKTGGSGLVEQQRLFALAR